jgi:hypothetical protein
MAGLSDYLENAVLNWLRGTNMPTAPTTVYLSLHTGDPGETGAAEHGSTGGYVRRAVTLTAPPSPITNSAAVEFPQATVNYTAAITHGGLWDALTIGNFLGGGALSASRTITSGIIPRFAAGAFSFGLD